MTEELFRNDAYLRNCEAQIIALTDRGVVLNRTVFYPEGGGQPGDRGELITADGRRIAIADTQKLVDDGIEHILAAPHEIPPNAIATEVTATIDWSYRHRHMRMHTCLHLLCSLIPFPVTGGSINQDKGRLDFDMSEGVDKAELEQALNRLVATASPVQYRWISDEELRENMTLVRTMSVAPPTGQGKVRLVEVEEIDLQPCGGTHVANSREIGRVRIGKVEKKGKHNRRINVHLEN